MKKSCQLVYSFQNYELTTTWPTIQQAFILRFSEVYSEGQTITVIYNIKQKKHEIVENYYDKDLQLVAIIPNQLYNVYLGETFHEGLHSRLKIAILGMPCHKQQLLKLLIWQKP